MTVGPDEPAAFLESLCKGAQPECWLWIIAQGRKLWPLVTMEKLAQPVPICG